MRVRKDSGAPPNLPHGHSADPHMGLVRYCNVRREEDKVTKWIAENWRKPNAKSPMLGAGMALARMVNYIPSLQAIGKMPLNVLMLERAKEVLQVQRANGGKIWTSAYTISTNGHSMDKLDYVFDKVLRPVYEHMKDGYGGVLPGTLLGDYHEYLISFNGLGSFLAAQIVADMKNTDGNPLKESAHDWQTWSAPGPGSLKGLTAYFGVRVGPSTYHARIKQCWAEVQFLLPLDLQELHMQDFQNCLCEFSKYCRVKEGGHVRNKYPSGAA